MRMRFSLLLLLVLLPAALLRAEYFTLLDSKTFSIINKFDVTNTSNLRLDEVMVTVLAGSIDDDMTMLDGSTLQASAHQQRVQYVVTPKFGATRADYLGNVYGIINLGSLSPGEKRTVTLQKIVINSGIRYDNAIYALKPDYAAFLDDESKLVYAQYLQPSKHIESDMPALVNDVKNLDWLKAPALLARDIFAGVNVYLTYDLNPAYANKGALNAHQTRRGVCTEFAGLFAAFCRIAGIPARVASGYWNTEPMRKNIAYSMKDKRHAWAEFYLPEVGWVPVEMTAIAMRPNGQRAVDYNYFANLQPNDRHFIWSYGLEPERESNINVTYSYRSPTPVDGQTLLRADMVEESVTWIDLPVQ